MSTLNAHDWFREKLSLLLAEASSAGFSPDVSQAVITDLMNGNFAADLPPPDENWSRDLGEPVEASSEMPRHDTLPAESVNQTPLMSDAVKVGGRR